MRDFFVFGDSIAYGQWDEQGGWVQRLRSSLDQSYVAHRSEKTYVYNMGIPGETAEDVLRRFVPEITPRLGKGKKHSVIFAIGMNDSHIVHKTGRPKFTAEAFTANMKALVEQARQHADRLAFVGLNPVDEPKVTPLPWNAEKSYSNDRIAEFNGILEKMAAEEGIFFADVWSSYVGRDHRTLLSDGLHPNASGHRRIAEAINPFMHEKDAKPVRAV